MNNQITKEHLKSCQESKKAYEGYLQAQRDIEKVEEKKRREAAAQKEIPSEKNDLQGELDTFKAGVNAALAVVMEGDEEMGKCLAGNAPGTLKMSQAKVTMGLKRKGELDKEVIVIEKKIRKLEVYIYFIINDKGMFILYAGWIQVP